MGEFLPNPEKKPKKSKSDRTSGLLLEYILESGLKPGDRLPSEEEMAVRFGVSRVSVREALRGLKFMGLLESSPRRGTSLAEMDFDRLSRYISFQLAFCPMSVEQLLDARSAIEMGHLEIVSGMLDAESCTRLREAAEASRRRDDSREEEERSRLADLQFHRRLLEIGGNPALQAFSRLLENFFRHLQGKSVSLDDNRRTVEEHLQLVDALREGNLDLARGVMRRHLVTHYREER